MRLSEIEKKAKMSGINDPHRFTRRELIRAIQKSEGNSICFGAPPQSFCGELNCCWRPDCLKNNP